MEILVGLRDKLRFIERFYETASAPFYETKRKIELGEAPFTPPAFDPDVDDADEPPFLEEWIEADESINLIGQAAVELVHKALQKYLEWYLKRNSITLSESGEHYMPDKRIIKGRPLGVGFDRSHHHLRKEHPHE